MAFVYIPYKHSVHTDDVQAYSTFGMRCWETGGPALKLCGQIADICPDETFVKKLALHCTRERLEPCHMLCVVEDALAGGLSGKKAQGVKALPGLNGTKRYNINIIVHCRAGFG